MTDEQIIKKFAEAFGIKEEISAAAYNLFLTKTAEKLKQGETLSVQGFGFFKKAGDNVLHFVDALREDKEKLFTKIELPEKDEDRFDFNEALFDVGAEKPVVNPLDEDAVNELENLDSQISEKINSFEILEDFDPYLLELSMEKESDSEETQDEEPVFDETISEEELETNLEAANELDTDLQKELEDELLSDFEETDVEELNDETSEEENGSEEPEDETEEPELEKEEETRENLENEVINDDELNSFLNDDTEKADGNEEQTEEAEKKTETEENASEKEDKKKKSFFSFLKRKKKEKKPEKEEKNKTENKEEEETGEEGKKKISKKLLIILIAVFAVITAGGVYYFFFTGDETHEEKVTEESSSGEHGTEHGGEHGKESIEDSLRRHRKHPLTPEEIGEQQEPTGHYSVDINKPHEQAVDESAPIVETELEDPLSMKEFPNEKKITNTIYLDNGKYMVQISSWKRSSRAIKIVEKLRRYGYNAFIVKAYLPALGGTWYRVRIGFFDTLEEAKEFLRKKEYLNVR